MEKCSDVSSLATLSKGASDTVVDMVADENCAVWETIFKLSHSSLHEAMKESNDTRTTWQARLQALVSMTAQSKSEAHETFTLQTEKKKRRFSLAMSKWFRPEKKKEEAPSTFHICFYNNPNFGLQVNIRQLNGAVLLYAFAQQSANSVAEVAVGLLDVSPFAEASHVFSRLSRIFLVVVGIGGRNVSSFDDYGELLKFIDESKRKSDFIFMRFMKPAQCNWEIQQGAFSFPSECMLPTPSMPTVGLY
jgi:hypothetical protein